MNNEMLSMSNRSIEKNKKDRIKHEITYILVHFLNQSLIFFYFIDSNDIYNRANIMTSKPHRTASLYNAAKTI